MLAHLRHHLVAVETSFAPPSYHASPPRVAPERSSSSPVRATASTLDGPRGEPDRVRDPVGARAAVADDGDARAGRAGSRRRWCRGPSRAAARRAPGAAAGRRAVATGFERAASPTAPATARAVPSIVFSATLPVKPSVTITSAASAEQVAALDVAAKVDARPRRRARRARRRPRAVPFFGLLADREQRHPRALDAEHRAAEGGAQVGELDQVAGAHLGVGADVEQQRRRAVASRDGELHRRAPAGARRASRRSANSAAVIVAPVGPALASACERPSATSAAASTIEASGASRTAPTGSSSLVISSGGVDQLDAVDAVERRQSSPGRRRRARAIPSAAAVRAPATITSGPRSAPRPSRATVVTGLPRGAAARRPRRSRARSPRARRTCRRSGRPGAGGEGCGSAGTRSAAASRPCASARRLSRRCEDCLFFGTAMATRNGS